VLERHGIDAAALAWAPPRCPDWFDGVHTVEGLGFGTKIEKPKMVVVW